MADAAEQTQPEQQSLLPAADSKEATAEKTLATRGSAAQRRLQMVRDLAKKEGQPVPDVKTQDKPTPEKKLTGRKAKLAKRLARQSAKTGKQVTEVEEGEAVDPDAPKPKAASAKPSQRLEARKAEALAKHAEAPEKAPEAAAEGEAEERPGAETKPKVDLPEDWDEKRATKAFIKLQIEQKKARDREKMLEERERQHAAKLQEIAEREEAAKTAFTRDKFYESMKRAGVSARDILQWAHDEKNGTVPVGAKQPQEQQDIAKIVQEAVNNALKPIQEEKTKLEQEQVMANEMRILNDAISQQKEYLPYVADEDSGEVYRSVLHIYQQHYEPMGLPLDLQKILGQIENNLREHYEGKLSRVRGTSPDGARAERDSENKNLGQANRTPEVNNLDAAEASTPAPKRAKTPREKRMEAIERAKRLRL